MSRLLITLDGVELHVEVSGYPEQGGGYMVYVNGAPMHVVLPPHTSPEQIEWALVNTTPYELLLDRDLRWLETTSGRHSLHVRDLEATVARPVSGDGRIKAPIPGIIARVLIEAGQAVKAGQPVLVLEAMKMENEIVAPRAGTVVSLNVVPGQTVILHELLAEVG